jgi:regulatory protein YycI of two-component signal transduction system YycFG
MKYKKSQIEMGETIFIVIIIIILILMGLVFLSKHEEQNVSKSAEEFFELDSVAQAQLIASLPELSDSALGVKEQMSFDTLKLSAFQDLTELHPDLATEYYFEQLGNINITIEQIFPKEEGVTKRWEIYVNDFNVQQNQLVSLGRPMMLPVSLYDPIQNERYFALLYITHYRRR